MQSPGIMKYLLDAIFEDNMEIEMGMVIDIEVEVDVDREVEIGIQEG